MAEETYHHFTDEKGLKAILKDGMIRESTDIVQDARLGRGVYVTQMDPHENSKSTIAKNNYDGAWKENKGKVEHVIEMKLPAEKVVKMTGPRDVGMHKGPIDLSKVPHTVKRVPDKKGK